MHIGTVYKMNSKGERKAYCRLEESYRNSCGQPRTRRLCVLGYLKELPTLKQHMLLLSCIEQLAYHGQRPMSGYETVDSLTYEFYEKMVRNGRLAEVKEAMCELLGIDPMSFSHRHLHKSANRLYELHTELEDWLHNRVCTLFDVKDEILLFDLTNTCFEGRME